MIKLDNEKVILLHRTMTDATGGDPGLRDPALLDSALEAAYQTFGGEELYPTLEEKGARLACSLVSNHAFVDGNKRIGIFALLIFLEVNGVRIDASSCEVARIGLALASGEMKYEALLSWIREHRI